MAADLHIHVFEGITVDDLQDMFSNTLGSKYFNPKPCGATAFDENSPYSRVSRTPNVWIGEVSWLKAAVLEDDETFIPNTVVDIHQAIGEDLPILDDYLTAKILAAFDEKNTTGYRLADVEKVRKFLEEHNGKRIFTVSW